MKIQEQKEAAERLGVTARTIRDWRENFADFPDCSRGYDLDAIEAWRDKQAKKGSERGSQMQLLKIARANEALKRDRIRTRKEELDLKLREGEHLPRQAYELFIANLLSMFADWCEQLPDLLIGECCPKCKKKLPARIKKELDRRREQLADDLQRSPQES